MNLRHALPALLLLALALPLAAQTPTAGDLHSQSGGTIPLGPYTYIDPTHPVTADGVITNVATRWLTDNACAGEIMVRFFRLDNRGILGTLQLVGAAGPFNSVDGLNQLTFPAIAVKKGDLLAITQLKLNCGGVTFNDSPPGNSVYEVSGDFNGGSLNGSSVFTRAHETLNAVASNGASRLVGTLPVAGSAAGAFGSFFRTDLTITNNSGYASSVSIVFHPAGASSSAADPARQQPLAPGASFHDADIVATMGRSGLGTLEILTDSYAPTVSARIYNDAGAAGTSGFSEELVTPADVIPTGSFQAIPLPVDVANYRVNIGIRTFDAPTTVIASVYDATGHFLGNSAQHSYPPNYFEQVSLAAFLANVTPPAGGYAQVYMTVGSAVLYSSTTDNRTNDSSLKMITFH